MCLFAQSLPNLVWSKWKHVWVISQSCILNVTHLLSILIDVFAFQIENSSFNTEQGWPKSGIFFKKSTRRGFLGSIDFSPSNYRVLLGFIEFYWIFFSFLNGVWAIFDFCPFELLLILALFITRFYGVLWGYIGFYWVFSLFLNEFGAIWKKI